MSIEVLFFASLREVTGVAQLTLSLPQGAGYAALLEALRDRLSEPAMAALQAENVRLARNQALVTPPLSFQDGDELAFLPPVTGG